MLSVLFNKTSRSVSPQNPRTSPFPPTVSHRSPFHPANANQPLAFHMSVKPSKCLRMNEC